MFLKVKDMKRKTAQEYLKNKTFPKLKETIKQKQDLYPRESRLKQCNWEKCQVKERVIKKKKESYVD